ncbi:MAG: IS256 family transposase [Proteobacteria bacterium]|nr:IS256 family transposase [Pseudomonadota bacterium]MBU4294990.1 IS256 family transposase [Pseudomonadota bacterium]MCG2746658.1 IS256 family transposase [Desulfobulbaceae bacterium]
MACLTQDTQFGELLELVASKGLDEISEPVALLFNLAMRLEREKYLKAGAYERTEQREGYANGFKPKTIKTRFGQLDLAVPQVRDGGFYPNSLEKGMRSERALKLALAEMYIHGVSTRKVARITEQMCGFEISSGQVSRASADLDDLLEKWRNRPLGCFPYVYLDAMYEKVRQGGQVVDCAALIAIGVDDTGRRQVLGASVKLSEHEVHWRSFLNSLQSRGLHGVHLFISDDHAGLKAARKAIFPATPWQRCQFHLQQNAQSYVPKKSLKKGVAAEIRAIFNAPSDTEAKRLVGLFVDKYEKVAPPLSQWAEKNIPEGLAAMQFPEEHQRKIRTSNMLERVNKEVRRRTRVAGLFPNETSCLRLISAVLMEISDDWATGKKYLKLCQ